MSSVDLMSERALMHRAFWIAGSGTCQRLKVGAVLYDPRSGHNTIEACNGRGDKRPCDHGEDSPGPCDEAIHAEASAIATAAARLIPTQNRVMAVTHSPCLVCAMLMYEAEIARVVYCLEFRDYRGLEYLRGAGVEVVQLTV